MRDETKTRTEFKIFVASPNDLEAERDIVKEVAEELNDGIAETARLMVIVKRWKDNAYPGFHERGPQGIIDEVLGIGDCDVVVGILGARFGTPTADARGGTEHEFRLAYEAWKSRGRPELFFYFKQTPDDPAGAADGEQRRLVEEFKKSFPKEGLWCPYKSEYEFSSLLRRHLTNFIKHRYLDRKPAPANPTEQTHAQDGPSFFSSVVRGAGRAAAAVGTFLLETLGLLVWLAGAALSFLLPAALWLLLLLTVTSVITTARVVGDPKLVVILLVGSFALSAFNDLFDTSLSLSNVSGACAVLVSFFIASALTRVGGDADTVGARILVCMTWCAVVFLLTDIATALKRLNGLNGGTRYLVPGFVAGAVFTPGGGAVAAAAVMFVLTLLVIFLPTLQGYGWYLNQIKKARYDYDNPPMTMRAIFSGQMREAQAEAQSRLHHLRRLKGQVSLSLLLSSLLPLACAVAAYWLVDNLAVRPPGAAVPSTSPGAFLAPVLGAVGYFAVCRLSARSGEPAEG